MYPLLFSVTTTQVDIPSNVLRQSSQVVSPLKLCEGEIKDISGDTLVIDYQYLVIDYTILKSIGTLQIQLKTFEIKLCHCLLLQDIARLVYGLITRMDTNIGGLISGQMTMVAQSNSSRLGFPSLITTLCRSRGVGSDALTSYENLRPAIDLAYIIRNCWNANDQTVNFLEARKTKLRAADAPSSFAPIAGILASSTSAPLPAFADLSA
ncbi:hypothetical protein GmHk_18G052182 [Glycine max]|nr:hypothetical protein GmHk_18G052182 [Glycine max]